jgi:hypothetical protein
MPSCTSTSSEMAGVAVAVSARMGGRPSTTGGAAQAQVRRAKVVSPLRHAVRFVDREERKLHALERRLHGRRADRLGRDDHQLDRALADRLQIGGALLRGARGIDARHADAGGLQLAHLILDEREQR